MAKQRLALRVRQLAESATLALAAKARALKAEGKDVVDFSLGEPDFDTPKAGAEAARAAIAAGDTHYPPVPGTPALRRAILGWTERTYGWRGELGQVLVSTGAKQTLGNLFSALLDPGDEVVLASPYWVSYPQMIELAGGRAVPIPTRAEDGFRLAPEAVEGALGPRTKILLLNSPSNPTGAVAAPEDVDAVVRLALDRDVVVVSDEIYGTLVFGDAKHRSALQVEHPRARELVVQVNGVSKMFAMTGWRLGWAVGPADLLAAAGKIQSQSTSGACTIAQAAAAGALGGAGEDAERMRRAFEGRCARIAAGFGAIPGVRVPRAQGAFYSFPDFSAYFGSTIGGTRVDGSDALAQVFLEQALVAAVPGAAFGAEGHVRFSYALEERLIDEGVARIARLLATATPGPRA